MNYNNDFSNDFKGLWISSEILKRDDISKSELLVLSIITNLDQESGCYATNKYFAKVLRLSPKRISELINILKGKGLITSLIDQERGNKRILRSIYRKTDTLSRESRIPSAENHGEAIHDNKEHYNINNNKIYKKKERGHSHFDFLKLNYSNEIDNIMKQYKMSSKECERCIKSFNEKEIKNLTINRLEKYIVNWYRFLPDEQKLNLNSVSNFKKIGGDYRRGYHENAI